MSDDLKRLVFVEPDAEWESRKWGGTEHVDDPMADAYALSDADKAAAAPVRIVSGGWVRVGAWKYRLFGNEIQLRSMRLPHIPIDVWRVEAEALFRVLGDVLGRPAPLPYRTPWHERLRMWWLRRVWSRKHAAELAEARAALIEETLRGMPQMGDGK